MNRFKSYDISKVSFSDIEILENDYLKQVKNKYIKKLEVKIKDNDLNINIEPYYYESNKWSELEKVLKNRNINFWFRDDDIGYDDEKLIEMMKFFEKKNINLLLAAIPSAIDLNTKNILSKFNNYTIAQHGYSHINYSDVECAEFTIDRDPFIVKQEIQLGDDKLRRIFGKKYMKVFIPPWFEIDDNTHKIINELNYMALSNYWHNQKNKYGMNEINCQVDLIEWEKAWTFGGEEYVLEQILSEISAKNGNCNIGILLHHERLGKESYKFLNKFLDFIKGKAKIIDFSTQLKKLGVKYGQCNNSNV